MNAPYTPDTAEIRDKYLSASGDWPADPAEFDRWLEAHDAKVRAETIAEAQQVVTRVCRDDLEDYYGDVRGRILAAMNSAYLPSEAAQIG